MDQVWCSLDGPSGRDSFRPHKPSRSRISGAHWVCLLSNNCGRDNRGWKESEPGPRGPGYFRTVSFKTCPASSRGGGATMAAVTSSAPPRRLSGGFGCSITALLPGLPGHRGQSECSSCPDHCHPAANRAPLPTPLKGAAVAARAGATQFLGCCPQLRHGVVPGAAWARGGPSCPGGTASRDLRRRAGPSALCAALRPPGVRTGRGRERWGREPPPRGVPEDFEPRRRPPGRAGGSGRRAGPRRDAVRAGEPPGGAGSRARPARVLRAPGP